ncbi:uncharacterized protein [Malus domestica]|uniref:uncharacterized protein isoform X4 n=1 Tax=Malus domestica TaxID=3750 RepID=UPI0010A9C610|nr:uncharacterized protein LOC103407656 isoform X3 [Malus domestica]
MTVDSICVGIKGFLKELKIIENGIPSECFKFWAGLEMLKNYAFESVGDSQCGRYWVPVLNYFWLQSMLLLLMMHLFYLLVFASFFLIMERYSSKKNTSSVYTLHHCSEAQAATTMSMENRESDRGIASPVHPIQGN